MSLRPTCTSVVTGIECREDRWHLTNTSMRRNLVMLATAVLSAIPAVLSAQTPHPELPPFETIVERVLERAQQEEAEQAIFKQCYGYTRARVTEFRNGNGVLKSRKAKTRVNNPVIVPVVYHPPPLKAESERATNTSERQSPSETHTNVRGKAFEKSDFPLNADLLKRFDFSLAGREVINGRPTLVVDFKPANRKLPERSIKDRFINKASGRVWLDETDYAVAKADLRLSEKVNVIGGLVGAVSKFTLTIERERTPEGLWFIREQEWHLEGREVFVRRKVDYHEEYKDVRKVQEPGAIEMVQFR